MNGEAPAVNGRFEIHAGANQQDDSDRTPSLFDESGATRPGSSALTGMRAALDREGNIGRAALRQLVLATARRKARFSASDVDHSLVATASPNSLPATFGALAREGVIVEVGVQRSTRPEARGRLERVWSLADNWGAR